MTTGYYVNQLQSIFDGQPWLAETLMKKVGHLSPAEVFVRPMPSVHSVAEIVAHIVAWRTVLIERLRGNLPYNVTMQSPQDWPTLDTLIENGWEQLKQELLTTQTDLITLLTDQSNQILTTPYDADGHSFEHLIMGIIQHDLYHLGQIGLVISMLKSGGRI